MNPNPNPNLTKARFFEERARKHQKDEARRARYARAAERYRLAAVVEGVFRNPERACPSSTGCPPSWTWRLI
jgi:hypothetical protein